MSSSSLDWRDVTVGEICEFKYGKSLPESARAGGDIPVFGSNGEIGRHNEAITGGPTIVIGRKGSFGEVAYSPQACWPIDTTYFVDATVAKADLRWLAYRLAALGLTQLNRAATIPGLNREDAYRKRMLLPPLPEQRRIAEILDKAAVLRAKRRAVISQLDTLTQSIFLDMFGDPIANAWKWPTYRLEEIAGKITDGTHKTPDYQPSGIEFLSAKDLKNGGIEWGTGKFISEAEHRELVKRCNPEFGDILLAKSGSLGTVAIIDRRHQFSLFESLCLIKHDRSTVEGQYLCNLLRFPSMQSHLLRNNKGVAIRHLHLVDVRNLRVPLPPKPLQDQFSARIVHVSRLRAAYEIALTKVEELFSSLQQQAFRGARTFSHSRIGRAPELVDSE